MRYELADYEWVFIAEIIAVLSIATLLLINHTRLIVDPQTPPGTTFNAAKDAART
jgi:hypothetical protein